MRKVKWLVLGLALACAVGASAMEVTLSDANLKLQVYGYIKADLTYDTQATAPGTEFSFWVLPKVAGENDGRTQIGARETRLGLNLGGPDAGEWKTTGKLEMDFYGGGNPNSYNPRMRLAYLDLAHSSGLSFRMGQDWDTFCAVVPRIVNFAYLADIGALGLRRPQARATQEIKLSDSTKIVLKAAIAQTVGQDLDGGGTEDGADAELPTVQWNMALYQKLWAEKPAMVAFSGHYGQETVDATDTNMVIIANDDEDFDTWSAQGSILLPITKCLALQGTVWSGANLDTYFGGIGQGVNYGLREEIEAKGGWAQVLLDPTAKLSMSVGYAVDDPDDEDLNPGMRSKNEQIFANAFYKLTPAVTVMAEYSFQTTDYMEGEDVENNRIQVAARYAF